MTTPTKANEFGMRPMQERAYERRDEPYLLIKSPPASGKSRALLFTKPILLRLLPFALWMLLSSCSEESSVNAPVVEVNEGALPSCKITPDGGYFFSVNLIKITVSCPTPGATIRYTLDGSQPLQRSPVYADSITLPRLTNYLVVKARSWQGTDSSPWVQAVLMDSLFDPIYLYRGAALFSQSVMVGLGYPLNGGWKYLYTTDGSEPSPVAGGSTKAFGDAFTISSETTVRVKAVRGAFTYPVVFERTFTPTPPYSGPFGALVDARDGQSYRTVRIGSKTWMAENLRYLPDTVGANCYGGDAANCRTDGVLYNWAKAMDIDSKFNAQQWDGSDKNHRGICPQGSHLPSDSEWTALQSAVQEQPDVGQANVDLALLSDSGWLNNRTWQRDDLVQRIMMYTYTPGKWTYNGVDLDGFSVLPAGTRGSDGVYVFRQYYAGFWTATRAPEFTNFSCARNFYGGYRGIWTDVGNGRLQQLSVRCVLDP
ncbi:MAG: chitobiase/beta-hexosaminidase C-terminal domain-containing protein [Fibrobacteres bacterium]|nr:chitobiase/beta-hexosaminidase C-terminal domain-containing protein [Fibrobacterota bacterium]